MPRPADVYAEYRDLIRLPIVSETSALTARGAQASVKLDRVLVGYVAGRPEVDAAADLRRSIAAAATIGVLRVAVEHWMYSGGLSDLSALLTEALALVRADYGLRQMA